MTEEQPQYVRFPLATRKVRAVWALLAINILVYIVLLLLSFVLPYLPGLVDFLLAQIPELSLASPYDFLLSLGWKDNFLIAYQGQYWRFLTAMFLHGSLLHILFNGFALYALGPETERIYGISRFLAIYFISGFAGGVASFAFSPNPSVGASGAIFGLIGCLGVFFYMTRDILGEIGRRQLQNMIAIVVINIFIGISAGGVIDNYAHMGGLVGGVVSGWFLLPRYTMDRRFLPPLLERHIQLSDWVGIVGVFLLLSVVTVMITPPI